MILETGSRLLFTGDSITDVGRARPVGEPPFGLGEGYPKLVSGMLTAYLPEMKIHVMNTAISGDRIRDLKSRWQTDVLDLKPDWVCMMIGINDVWRHFDLPTKPSEWVEEEEFVSTYRELIECTKPCVKGIILMPPYYLDQNESDPMTKMVHKYADDVKKLAEEYGLMLCDVQKEMDATLAKLHHMAVSQDRVHPIGGHTPGHFLIARAFMKSVGCWDEI